MPGDELIEPPGVLIVPDPLVVKHLAQLLAAALRLLQQHVLEPVDLREVTPFTSGTMSVGGSALRATSRRASSASAACSR